MSFLAALLRPKTRTQTWVASLLFWNVAAAAAFTFVFNGTHHFLSQWMVATAIAEVTAMQCYTNQPCSVG